MRVCELEAECAMGRTIFGLGLVADVETKAGVGRSGARSRPFPPMKIPSDGSKRPTPCTQQNAVLQPRRVDIVDAKIRPVECRRDRLERGWLVHLVHFGHVQHRLRAVDLLEVPHDFENWRFCTIEVQAG